MTTQSHQNKTKIHIPDDISYSNSLSSIITLNIHPIRSKPRNPTPVGDALSLLSIVVFVFVYVCVVHLVPFYFHFVLSLLLLLLLMMNTVHKSHPKLPNSANPTPVGHKLNDVVAVSTAAPIVLNTGDDNTSQIIFIIAQTTFFSFKIIIKENKTIKIT